MAEISGFFPSVSGDRKYKSDFLAKREAAIICNGVYNGELGVTADGSAMAVILPAGRAWINGYFYGNDAPLTLPITNADGVLNRKDTVVLRWDINARSITAQVLKGTLASSAAAPGITRTAEQYDLKLAEINIPAGTTTITQTLITDTRADESVCGIVAGAVQQLSTEALYSQFTAQFHDWFNNVQEQLSGSVAGNLQNQINSKATQIYTHAKTGTVHVLAGSGSNGKFEATADYTAGDTFTVNGTAINASLQDGSALPHLFFSAGNWVNFNFDGSRLNFKSAGGGAFPLNFFVQPNEPITKNGLWIQAPEKHSVNQIINRNNYVIGGSWETNPNWPPMPRVAESPYDYFLNFPIARLNYGTRFYALYGWAKSSSVNETVNCYVLYIFDTVTKTWSHTAPILESNNRQNYDMSYWVYGRNSETGNLFFKGFSDSFEYNPSTGQVTALPNITNPGFDSLEGIRNNNGSSTLLGQSDTDCYIGVGKCVSEGTYQSDSTVLQIYKYNIATDSFALISNVKLPDTFPYHATLKGVSLCPVYLFGHVYSFYDFSVSSDSYNEYQCTKFMDIDLASGTVTKKNFTGTVKIAESSSTDIAVYQNKIYKLAYDNRSIFVYDTVSDTWATITTPYSDGKNWERIDFAPSGEMVVETEYQGTYTNFAYAMTSETLPPNSLALLDGHSHEIALITAPRANFLRSSFNDIWWYDTAFREYPTYIGDGKQWNKIKN